MKRLPFLFLLVLATLLAACSPAGTEAPGTLRVKSIFPVDGATNVPVDAFVLVDFTAPLDTLDLTSAIALEAGETTVDGTYVYDADTMSLMFVPNGELLHGTHYTVVVSDWVRGQDGATLARAVEWGFTTVERAETGGNDDEGEETPGERVPDDELPDPEPGMPDPDETEIVLPGVVSVSPMPWTRANRNTAVEVLFTKTFDPGVLEAGVDVKVYPLFFGLLRAWFGLDLNRQSGVLSGDGDTATFTFNGALSSQSWYWVFLEIDLEDDVGNPLAGRANWLFKTTSN